VNSEIFQKLKIVSNRDSSLTTVGGDTKCKSVLAERELFQNWNLNLEYMKREKRIKKMPRQ
jgi:aspartate/tyrosine/aromatic aminotransferase